MANGREREGPFDPERIELETSGGYRPPSGLGERVLIALAGLALVGGALIAVGNLLPERDEAAPVSATPTATPTPRPSRTPRPRPTPTPFPAAPPQVTVVRGQLPEPPAYPQHFAGWLRALVDLPIRPAPSQSMKPAGTLKAGQIAYVSSSGEVGSPQWLSVDAPRPAGYISLDDVTSQRAQLLPVGQDSSPTSVRSVVGGGGGFMAFGDLAAAPFGMPPPLLSVSPDGVHWSAAQDPPRRDYWPITAAWGPAGWLAATALAGPQEMTPWVWRSADGSRWTVLGSLPGLERGLPSALAGTGDGYLLFTSRDGGGTGDLRAWFSTDGELWEERPVPEAISSAQGQLQLVGTPAGFFAWTDAVGWSDLPRQGRISFSPNGWDWTQAEDGPNTTALRLAWAGGEVRALSLSAEGANPRTESWIGTVEGGTLRWRPDPQRAIFSGTGVTGLASNGERALAIGWDTRRGTPQAWLTDDGSWRPVTAPWRVEDGFLVLAAGSPTGFVVVANDPSLRASNPTVWHSSSGRSWRANGIPLVPRVDDPSPAECPPNGMDALGFATMERALAVVCLGDEPVTFRAYSGQCEGCYATCPGRCQPSWLVSPGENLMHLSPIESDSVLTAAVVDPSLTVDPAWRQAWVEVTGHFDDPAAAECRWVPSLEMGWGWWGPAPSVTVTCRQAFVVTAVKVVDGPG